MRAARKEFVVVALGDRNAYGYDEHTLPILLRLMESSAPDARLSSHRGVVGYYLPSSRAIAAILDLVSAAETLRDSDSRFASLGIGSAELQRDVKHVTWHHNRLTNRWSQPLATVKSTFEFMKQLLVFTALAAASGG
jgi:hypothetical protein